MHHGVSGGGYRARRDVPDEIRGIRRGDLPERGSLPVTTAEGELSAEEQTVLRGALAVLQTRPSTGRGAALQEVPHTAGPDETRADDPRYWLHAIPHYLGRRVVGQHPTYHEDIPRRQRDEEHRGNR